jgi:hypothetical protein
MADQPKDIWDKLDVVIKGAAAVLITGAITLYGINSDDRRAKTADDNRRAQVLVQTMSNREAAESDMKAKMFDTLMTHYFEKENVTTQIMFLRLIALNFKEYLHLRPFFEELAEKLSDQRQIKQLRKTAKKIIREEINQLVGSGGEVYEVDLKLGETSGVGESAIPLSLKLMNIKEGHIIVGTDPEDEEGFDVTFYDMPFSDNSTIGEMKYSVVLSKIKEEEKEATVQVVVFPHHYYSARDRLRIDQMMGDLLEQDLTGQ